MLSNTIKSYLYIQYNDDDNLQALVDAQNNLAQQYLDWANNTALPVYTGSPVSGVLLDWVGLGLYGLPRPSLSQARFGVIGPYNTYAIDTLAYNQRKTVNQTPNIPPFYVVNDDIYKRVITWHFFKGDGKQFNIRWLKRRIERFLTGTDGTDPPVGETYNISITFGSGHAVTIRLVQIIRYPTGGAIFNKMLIGKVAYNSLKSSTVTLPPNSEIMVFKAAVDEGVLELPFQFIYTVTTS